MTCYFMTSVVIFWIVKSPVDGAKDDIDLDDLHIYWYAEMDRGYPHIFIIRYLTDLVDCLIFFHSWGDFLTANKEYMYQGCKKPLAHSLMWVIFSVGDKNLRIW